MQVPALKRRPGRNQPEGMALENELALDVLADPSLDTWGAGLTIYELFSAGAPLFPIGKDTSHLEALAERTATPSLGTVCRPRASATHGGRKGRAHARPSPTTAFGSLTHADKL